MNMHIRAPKGLINRELEVSKLKELSVFALFFLVDYLLSLFINTDVLTLSIWVMYSIIVLVTNLRFFLKYSIYFFYYSTNVLAVYIIENNTLFLKELQTVTQHNGSLYLITLAHWVFISILQIKDVQIEKSVANTPKDNTKMQKDINIPAIGRDELLLICSFCIFVAYLLINGVNLPAASVGLDRFIYQHQYIKGSWGIIHAYIINLVPIAVIIAFHGHWKLSMLPIVPLCIYFLLVGHKFGIFLTIFMLFLPCIIEKLRLNRVNTKSLKALMLGSVSIAGGLYLTLFSFMKKTYGTNKNEFIEYIFGRLAQQGQMWWAVYGHEKGASTHFQEFIISAGALFKMNPRVLENKDYGIYKMMKLVTPIDVYNRKIGSYSRYAFSTDASLYYYFKTVGLILISIVFAILLAYITNWYWNEIKNKNWLGAIVSGYYYITILSTLLQSDFNVLFSRRAVALLLLYFVLKQTNLVRNIVYR